MPARTAEIFLGLIINPLCSSFAFKYQKSLHKTGTKANLAPRFLYISQTFVTPDFDDVDDGGFAILLEQNKVRRLVSSLPPPPPLSMLVF